MFSTIKVNPEEKVRRETVEEYLRRGGSVTKCPSKRAVQSLEGAAVIDGVTFSIITGESEAVPQLNRVSLAQYDMGMTEAIRPYHHLAWRDIERESAPAEARAAMEHRPIDADEIDYTEIN